MAASTVYWIGNAAAIAEVVDIHVSAVTTNGVVTVTINTKSVSYTVVTGDTTATAAANLQALLAACQFPEFLEATWDVSGNVVTATASDPGTPIYSTSGWGISVSTTGAGTTAFVSVRQSNISPSDINDPNNWLRNGINQVPQTGDFIVLADSSVPLLWNLNMLNTPATFTRWQSFTGTVGLPENNPAGYFEFRPTYLSLGGSSGSSSSASSAPTSITAILGQGTVGSGPTRERYNFGANNVTWVIRGAGTAQDDYAVRILSANAGTTLQITSVSVGVGMLPGESSSIGAVTVDGGGSVDLGPNVTVSGTLSLYGASADIFCLVPSASIQQGASLSVLSTGVTYPTVTCITGSTLVWNSDSNITTLTLQNASNMDCSQDVRKFTITTLSIDADTCQVNDPNNRTTITNAVTMNQRVSSGPFIFGSGKSFKITP